MTHISICVFSSTVGFSEVILFQDRQMDQSSGSRYTGFLFQYLNHPIFFFFFFTHQIFYKNCCHQILFALLVVFNRHTQKSLKPTVFRHYQLSKDLLIKAVTYKDMALFFIQLYKTLHCRFTESWVQPYISTAAQWEVSQLNLAM